MKKKVKYHRCLFIDENSDEGRLLTGLFPMLTQQNACALTYWIDKNAAIYL